MKNWAKPKPNVAAAYRGRVRWSARGEVAVDEGDDADPEDAFAWGAAMAEAGGEAEVEDGHDGFKEEAFRFGVEAEVEGKVRGVAVMGAPGVEAEGGDQQDGQEQDDGEQEIEQEARARCQKSASSMPSSWWSQAVSRAWKVRIVRVVYPASWKVADV